MSFDVFLNFDGDCRAALDFYARVFQTGEPSGLMTYGQNPGGCSDADRDRVLYASLPIFGHNVMFSDCPSGGEYAKGGNIALTLGTSDARELRRIFDVLSDGGEIYMPLGETFFSELYGMVRDKFEITWQLSLTAFAGATADFSALVKDRYSVRGFKPDPIEDAKLAAVLEAGRIAPTACNNQPQRIKVITGSDLAKADECTPCRFGAPAVLLVCYDKTQIWKRSFDGALSGDVDAAIVTTHMMLAAQEQGLGSCWVMYFDPAKTRELFALPENIIPVAYLPIGYPADDCQPADRHFDRKALEEILL